MTINFYGNLSGSYWPLDSWCWWLEQCPTQNLKGLVGSHTTISSPLEVFSVSFMASSVSHITFLLMQLRKKRAWEDQVGPRWQECPTMLPIPRQLNLLWNEKNSLCKMPIPSFKEAPFLFWVSMIKVVFWSRVILINLCIGYSTIFSMKG